LELFALPLFEIALAECPEVFEILLLLEEFIIWLFELLMYFEADWL